MNWDAIGAIGEIIGAAGVIVTLAYLAIQIRHSSDQLERNIQATKVQANDAIIANYNEWRSLIIGSDELSDIYIRGLTDISSLSKTERLRFNELMSTFIWISYQYWDLQTEKLVFSANEALFGHIMRYSGGRAWYEGHKPYMSSDFTSMLDEVLDAVSKKYDNDLTFTESSSMFAGPLEEQAGLK